MTTSNQEKRRPNPAIPLAERDADDVRAALDGKPAEAVEQWMRLHTYAKANHIGIAQLAAQTRISTAVLSSGFAGTYIGDYEAQAENIQSFFRRLENKDRYGDIRRFVELNLTQYLWLVFDKTSVNRRIQIVEGPEQCGKSKAAQEYCARNNHGRTAYVQLSGGAVNGVNDFIRQLGSACIKGMGTTAKLCEIKRQLREALEGTELVIIDEGHLIWKWSAQAQSAFFDFLRTDVHNNGRCGVVLISTNEDFLDRLNRFRRSGYNIGQILGRMRNETIRIQPEEHIVQEDVRELVKRYYEPGAKAVNLLHGIAIKPQLGHFGLILDVMNEAWILARRKKTALSDEIVVEVANRIVAGMKARKEMYA
jgi:hypothetical protein